MHITFLWIASTMISLKVKCTTFNELLNMKVVKKGKKLICSENK